MGEVIPFDKVFKRKQHRSYMTDKPIVMIPGANLCVVIKNGRLMAQTNGKDIGMGNDKLIFIAEAMGDGIVKCTIDIDGVARGFRERGNES